MWERVKGETEEALLNLPFKATYMFRPAYIQPMKGIKSRTPMYNIILLVTRYCYPFIKLVFPNFTTSTEKLGLAIIQTTSYGYEKNILEAIDINKVESLK